MGIVLEKEPEVSDGDHVNFVREFTWYLRIRKEIHGTCISLRALIADVETVLAEGERKVQWLLSSSSPHSGGFSHGKRR